MKFKFAGLAQIFAITCILCLSHCELGPAQTSELNIKYLRGAETAEGPFCGIYCVYAAAAILHKPIPIQDLLINKYVNSSEGSSLHDLLLAAEDHGLEALPVENITTSILSNSQYPIILHVRQGANDSKFNHFVLVVNAEDGIARVLDPDAPSKYTPLHELASRMDGYGLVVASERIDEKKLFAPQRIKFLLIGLGGVFFGLAAWYFASKSPVVVHPFGDLSFRGGRAIKQFASLLGFSAVVGLSWNYLTDEGLLAHPADIPEVKKEEFITSLKIVDVEDVKKMIKLKSAVLVDARLPRDYSQGHLPGAISLPVNSPRNVRQQVLSGIGLGIPLVVYCQSDSCTFSDEIAHDLANDGFVDIKIFRGGWNTWETATQTSAKNQ